MNLISQIHEYASALYSIALENDKKFVNDVQDVFLAFKNNDEIISILSSLNLSKNERKKIVGRIFSKEINKLNARDKKIMILRYGLFNTEEMTQKDVADLLGISQSYISRIEKKVIRQFQNLDK